MMEHVGNNNIQDIAKICVSILKGKTIKRMWKPLSTKSCINREIELHLNLILKALYDGIKYKSLYLNIAKYDKNIR